MPKKINKITEINKIISKLNLKNSTLEKSCWDDEYYISFETPSNGVVGIFFEDLENCKGFIKDIKYSDEGIFCHNSPIIFRFSSEDELEPKILNLKL